MIAQMKQASKRTFGYFYFGGFSAQPLLLLA